MYKNLLRTLLGGAILVTGLTASAQQKAPSLESLRINGMLMYDDDRSEDVLGFYEYTATAPVTRRALVLSPRNYLSGDAVVVDGKLYTYHMEVYAGSMVDAAYYTVVDVATGSATKSPNISWDLDVAYSHYASSAALNSVDGKVYCSGYEYNSSDRTLTPTLKIWNVTENAKEAVGTMQAALAVMSFDKDGNLYGITACSSRGADDGGRLVKVDKTTGSLTIVGDTGIRPWFDQSGVISPYDGRLYWFASEAVAGGGANDATAMLYAVDLATAKADAIGALPNGDEVVAAWIPAQTIPDAAPGDISGLVADFTAPSLAGKIKFDLPSVSYSGGALDGDVDWVVTLGGKTVASGTGAPGLAIAAEVEVPSSGEYTFDVVASNAAGNGNVDRTTTYIGYGVPDAVASVTFVVEDGIHEVSWGHVGTLAQGTYLDGDHASYRVVRQPGNVVLAEKWTKNTYSERAVDGDLQSTYYEITAVNGDRMSAPAKSNVVVTGSTIGLPYHEDFASATSVNAYDIVDSNKDGNTWSYYDYSKVVQIRMATAGTHDDWLVLPPVRLEKGYSYEFKFDCYATVASYVNILDVAMGLSAETMDTMLLEDIEVTGTKASAMKEVAVAIKPAETAVYRLGIHIKSATRQGTFAIKNVSVSAGSSTAVPAAPGLAVSAGAKGALSAVLTVSAPALTAGGDELENAVTLFTVSRDGEPRATIPTEAGKIEYTYEDNDVPAAGMHAYTVCAVNADGTGEAAEASLFIGRDRPLAPAGLRAADNGDGTVVLSWDTPSEAGANGGYVDVDRLVYSVVAPDKTVTTGITGTAAVASIATSGVQAEVTYKVGVKYSDDAAADEAVAESNVLIAGTPYTAPFAETFASAAAASQIWTKEYVLVDKNYNLEFSVKADSDHGGDEGGLKIYSYEKVAAGRWVSPLFDLSLSINPEISVWVNAFDANVSFELQVQAGYGDWQTVAALESVDGWTEVKAPLSDFRNKRVRFGLLAKFAGWYTALYADDFAVRENTSGIESVDADDNENLEIYNIQGIRVPSMTAPGVYIVRSGATTRKVVVN